VRSLPDPPRKPDQLRTQHLSKLQTPALLVHGTRDPFGSTEELQNALKLIPARTELLEIESAGHDLGFSKKSAGDAHPVDRRIADAFSSFFAV
jgi:predicted alpha/beta-hydrolase family hydrolase